MILILVFACSHNTDKNPAVDDFALADSDSATLIVDSDSTPTTDDTSTESAMDSTITDDSGDETGDSGPTRTDVELHASLHNSGVYFFPVGAGWITLGGIDFCTEPLAAVDVSVFAVDLFVSPDPETGAPYTPGEATTEGGDVIAFSDEFLYCDLVGSGADGSPVTVTGEYVDDTLVFDADASGLDLALRATCGSNPNIFEIDCDLIDAPLPDGVTIGVAFDFRIDASHGINASSHRGNVTSVIDTFNLDAYGEPARADIIE